MIRVFIADDQLLIRQGLRALLDLEREIEIVGEAGDGEEAVRIVGEKPVDVMLLDIRMPKLNGIEVLRELAKRNALPPTLILTTFDDADVVLDGVRAGASGFLLKDVSYEQLVGAIRAVAAGETVFQPAVTQRLLRASDRLRTHFESLPSPDRLTEREIEVVRLMSGGYSNREIAHALSTAEGTIKNHVSSILSKFGVRDRTRAVLKALEHGLLVALVAFMGSSSMHVFGFDSERTFLSVQRIVVGQPNPTGWQSERHNLVECQNAQLRTFNPVFADVRMFVDEEVHLLLRRSGRDQDFVAAGAFKLQS